MSEDEELPGFIMDCGYAPPCKFSMLRLKNGVMVVPVVDGYLVVFSTIDGNFVHKYDSVNEVLDAIRDEYGKETVEKIRKFVKE